MNTKISLDLDGVLLEFYQHYLAKYGQPKDDLTITKHVMGELRHDKQFWLTQPLINSVNFIPHCYCTARVISKDWIKEQLEINHLPKAPVYQVFGVRLSKYPQLKRSGANVHIDDSLSVFIDLNLKGIPTLLLDAPNNQEWGPIGRIYSLDIDEILETYNLFKNTIFPHFKELL